MQRRHRDMRASHLSGATQPGGRGAKGGTGGKFAVSFVCSLFFKEFLVNIDLDQLQKVP